jgi:virginiamycin A acetyltransferase
MISKKIQSFINGSLEYTTISTLPKNTGRQEIIQNCLFEENVNIQSPIISTPEKFFVGYGTYMNNGGYTRDNIFIGRYCSIGRRVTIGAGIHDISSVSTSPSLKPQKKSEYTEIEKLQSGILNQNKRGVTVIMNDVWIGDGAIIFPGIKIGNGAVVGANSTVTKDVPDYAIVVGSPAKLLRYRFSPLIIDRLLSSNWWDIETRILMNTQLDNTIKFLDQIEKMESLEISNNKTYSYKV